MKISLVQDYFSAHIEGNRARILAWIQRAALSGSNLVVFPECSLSGYLGFGRDTLPDTLIEDIVVGIEAVQQAAKAAKIGVLFGTYTRRCGRWYNTALFIDSEGEQIAAYDKLQLVDRDCYHVAPGASAPPVFLWCDLKVSFAICHDIRYPEVLRAVATRGSNVHFHLFFGARGADASFTQDVYDAHLCTRAVENGMFMFASNVSINEQMVRSQAVSPSGRVIMKAASWKPELITVLLPSDVCTGGWRSKRRHDLFPEKRSEPCLSYFERSWWPSEKMIIDHSIRGLNLEAPIDSSSSGSCGEVCP